MRFADNRFLHIVTVFKLFSHNWTVSILFSKKGWMYYNKEHLGDRTSRMEKAVQLLLKAIETDPNSGAAWYLIGR